MKSLVITIAFIKLIIITVWIIATPELYLGGTSDADYYNEYALGYIEDTATSIWPVILKCINDLGWYQRDAVAEIMAIANSVLYPFVIYKICIKFGACKKAAIIVIILYQCWPSNYLISFDIYRDNILLGIALLGVYISITQFKPLEKINGIILYGALAIIAFQFRPYLGFSIFSAYILTIVIGKSVLRWGVIIPYLLMMIALLGTINALDPLFEYRGEYGFESGGSSFGIGLINKNTIEAIGLIILSAIYQMGGFYIYDAKTSFIFLVESLPFLVMLYFSVRYIKIYEKSMKYTVLFFVIYSTVWIIGNDNLGTGIRLRIISYTVMLPIFSVALTNKFNWKRNG